MHKYNEDVNRKKEAVIMNRSKQNTLEMAKIFAYSTLGTGGIFMIIWLLCLIAPMV